MLHTALLAIAASVTQVPDSAVRVQTLDEATVTTHRNTALRSSAPLRRVSAADIELRGAVGLEEVLRTMAGVNVKDYGGLGGLKTVSIRSFGAQHTGVVYDGLAVTDCMNGQVDISRFNLDCVAEVRVDVAGTDNIFRPAKLSGFVGNVEIVTAVPQYSPSANSETAQTCGTAEVVDAQHKRTVSYSPCWGVGGVISSFGEEGTLNLALPLSRKWNLSAWGDYLNSRGDYPFLLKNGQVTTHEVRLNSQVSRFDGEVAAHARFDRYGTLRLKASAYDSSRGLPGSVILYTQHPTEHLWDRTLTASAQHLVERERWRLKSSLSYTHAYNRYVDDAPLLPEPEDDCYVQQQASLSVVGLLQATDRWSASLAEDLDLAHLDSTIPEAAFPTRLTTYTALSTRYAGPRLQAVATLLGIVATEQTREGEPAPRRSRLCPSASISFAPLQDAEWRIRASYKHTYRLPTFNDLYYSRVGNRNLRPERAQQFNLGTTWAHQFAFSGDKSSSSGVQPWRVAFTADAYYNCVTDRIVAIPTMFIWRMRNVGRVNMYGIDCTASLSGPVASWLRFQVDANYSLQYALDVTDSAAKNYRHQIAYTPRHSGSGVVAFLMPWFNVSYTLIAVGERFSLAQNTPAYRLEPYADHSVSLNRTFTLNPRAHSAPMHLRVSAEALNLAGHNYEVVKYYPMPGRQWRINLRYSF